MKADLTLPPFKKDEKVMVRLGQGCRWEKRYYSHFEDGRHYCFTDGNTSCSGGGDVATWNDVRKPTLEELGETK
jgi:hypothetical protein